MIKDNGVAFVQALGAGDLDAARAIAEKKQASEAPLSPVAATNTAMPDNEIVVGRAKAPIAKRIFGIGSRAEPSSDAADEVGKDNRALLQETLFDLLECKRLLDQAR
jgi:hypothetical protein